MADWYYQLNGENQGPVSEDDLRHIFDSGALPLNTPVWREGMAEWAEAQTITSLNPSSSSVSPNKKVTMAMAFENSQSRLHGSRSPVKWSFAALIIACCICVAAASFWTIKRIFAKHERDAVSERNQNKREVEQGSETDSTGGRANRPPIDEPAQSRINEPQNSSPTAAVPDKMLQATMPQSAKGQIRAFIDEPKGVDKWVKLLTNLEKQITQSQEQSERLGAIAMGVGLLKELSKRMNPSLDVFPPPLYGDAMKVNDLIQNLQEKMQNISGKEYNQYYTLSYSKGEQVWGLCCHDKKSEILLGYYGNGNNYFFDPSALDPSSAQLVTRREELYGRTEYTVVFSTFNNRRSVIVYHQAGPNQNELVAGFGVTDKLEIFCGYGPGSQQAERVAKAIAAFIIAYGGKTEPIQ